MELPQPRRVRVDVDQLALPDLQTAAVQVPDRRHPVLDGFGQRHHPRPVRLVRLAGA